MADISPKSSAGKTLQPDIAQAIAFAMSLPGKTFHIDALDPDTKRPMRGRTFNKTEAGRDVAVKFATAATAAKYGIYFNCNETKFLDTKVSEPDITVVHFLHVDLDLPDDTKPDDFTTAKSALLAKVKAFDRQPTLIINSGNGYGLFWEIEPVTVTPDNISELRGRNKALAEALGGDDCWNLDRLARLPFTINLPNAKKKSLGRIPRLSGVTEDLIGLDIFKVDDFPISAIAEEDSTAADEKTIDLDIPDSVDLSSLDELLRKLIVEGPDSTWTKSRSEAAYWAACELRRLGWSDGAIVYVLTDIDCRISANILEQQQRDPIEQAKRVIDDMNAKGVVRSETAAEEFADDDDDDFDLRPAAEDKPTYVWLDHGQMMEGEFPPLEYCVEDLVMKGTVNMMYGDGGTGKSTIAIQMGVAMAGSAKIFGRNTIKMPVLFVLAEDPDGINQYRIKTAMADLGLEGKKLDIITSSVLGEDVNVARITDDGIPTEGPFYAELVKKLKERPGSFVVLDSQADIAQLSEAARLAINAFYKRILGGLVKKYDATFLVLAHPSKASMRDGSGYAGNTGYKAAVRNMLYLRVAKDMTSTYREFGRLKNNYGADYDLMLAFRRGIFVDMSDESLVDETLAKSNAVLAEVIKLIKANAQVLRSNKGDGYKTNDLSALMLKEDKLKIGSKEIRAIMMKAEKDGILSYVKGYGKIAAGYQLGDVAFAPDDGGDFEA